MTGDLAGNMLNRRANMKSKRQSDPPFVLFVIGLSMIAGLMMLLWTLVRPVL